MDQPIAATAEDAQSAFLDADFYRSLGELPDISAPEVRSFSAGPATARIELGYRFAGELNGPAKAILDPKKLTWSQVTEVDLATGRSTVKMVPDNYGSLLSFQGWYELHDVGDHQCCQHLVADCTGAHPSSWRPRRARDRRQHPSEPCGYGAPHRALCSCSPSS